MLKLYTDASIIINKKDLKAKEVCGLGIVVCEKVGKQDVRHVKSTYTVDHFQDINLGEMLAILEGLKFIKQLVPPNKDKKPKVEVISDSSTCVDLLNGKPINAKNKALTKQQTKRNLVLNQTIERIKSFNKYYDVSISHIKGHRKYFQLDYINNNLADIMAKDGVRLYLDEKVRVNRQITNEGR